MIDSRKAAIHEAASLSKIGIPANTGYIEPQLEHPRKPIEPDSTVVFEPATTRTEPLHPWETHFKESTDQKGRDSHKRSPLKFEISRRQ